MKLSDLYWHRVTPLHLLLWPLSLLFNLFLNIRKLCYWLDFFPSVKLPVPVIVVDSITTDDGGKTPFVSWLIRTLLARGLCPGIVTQGGPDHSGQPEAVSNLNSQTRIRSKALLLAKRFEHACPVWVGNNVADVAQALLQAHPDCNVIICTFGLQYPRLERDFEIAVADFDESSFGNGLLLPAGPLRANLKRLRSVDAVVINSSRKLHFDTDDWAPTYPMKLVGDTVYNLSKSEVRHPVSILKDQTLQAVTTYGNARWLANQLQHHGLKGKLQAVADDHRFVAKDFSSIQAEAIIMLEEEAIQCREFVTDKVWALPVEAWINGEMQARVLNMLREKFADSDVLNELICPNCKCPLRHLEQENSLICDQEQLTFPIKDGIPVLQLQDSGKLAA
ncbi:tetraacyldisaccharide 4'-kinase [Nitrosomonas sp.]|uniref:tetraacyldisaccharide 4'-kinase n=1 Tax=Nitrosomonas sp. TaxID=42353 RepID=UPI00284D7CD6|nr:tetraacyldisaccharide 4'-kinase [Nitrosomonas sp.]MDR4514132.1 tetraacyldisaccharide 4'-kinase [Nitrosomonas sp.]